MQKKNNFKVPRIENEILNILNYTLKNVIYDEDLHLASFTYVNIDPAITLAKIYVDTFDRDYVDTLVTKLNESKGVFKSTLAKKMNIRRIPDIIFYKDESIDRAIDIDNLLDKIKK